LGRPLFALEGKIAVCNTLDNLGATMTTVQSILLPALDCVVSRSMSQEQSDNLVVIQSAASVENGRRVRQGRNLALDYALGAAIIGLNPFPGTLTITLLISSVLVLKMMRDIGAHWGFARGQDPLAIAGNLFGGLGAFAIALMAWVTVFCIGILAPLVRAFALSAALFTLTWAIGQTTNQFYASGRSDTIHDG